MKTLLPIALFGAILLAGCDTGTQASTSSETQTALQELADNVRTPVKSALSPAFLAAAGRALTSADSLPVFVYEDNRECLPFQSESFQSSEKIVAVEYGYQNLIWYSFRTNQPQHIDGTPYYCGDGAPMKLFVQNATRDSAILWEYDGWFLRSRGQGFFDSAAFHEQTTFASGFSIAAVSSYGGIDSSSVPHSMYAVRSFDSGRYQFVDTGSILPYSGLRELCSPIIDLHAATRIGSFCYELDSAATSTGAWTDSVVIKDASGRRVVPRQLPTNIRDDSMGLRLQDPTLDRQACTTDSIHLRVWVKTVQPVAELTPAQTRFSIRRSMLDTPSVIIPLPEDALGVGTWVTFSVLPEGNKSDSIVVNLERAYWPEPSYYSSTSQLTIPLSDCRHP